KARWLAQMQPSVSVGSFRRLSVLAARPVGGGPGTDRRSQPLGATTIFSTTSHTSRGVVRFGGGDAKRQKRPETPSKWQPGSRSGSMSSTSGQATLEDWLTRIDLIEIEVNESNTFRPHTAFLYRRSVGTHMAPDTDGSRRGDGARLRRARGPAGRSAPSATGHEPSAARPEAVHLSPPQARSTMTAPRPIVRKA